MSYSNRSYANWLSALTQSRLGDVALYAVSSRRTFKLPPFNLISEAFAVSIPKHARNIILNTPLDSMLRHKKLSRLLESKGNIILYYKVTNNDTIDDSSGVRCVKAIINNTIAAREIKSGCERRKVAKDVCCAIMSLNPRHLLDELRKAPATPIGPLSDLLPALAAAVGAQELLSSNVSSPTDLFANPIRIFPTAFDAAVTASNTAVLQWQLDYIIGKIKKLARSKRDDLLELAGKNVTIAIKIALRQRKHAAGEMLFAALYTLRGLATEANMRLESRTFGRFGDGAALGNLWDGFYMDAIRHDGVGLIYEALDEARDIRPQKPAIGPSNRYILRTKDLNFLLRLGSPRMLAKLLTDGHIDPNQFYDERTLIAHALRYRRRSLAQVLLRHGANVNGTAGKQGKTALWYAEDRGFYMDVLFLIKHGARSKFRDYGQQSTMLSPSLCEGRFGKTHFLLEYAMIKQRGGKSLSKRDIKMLEETMDR
jgi:hypothetical protein